MLTIDTRPQLGRLRVLTMNLWQRYGAWTERRAVLIDGLRALTLDLVAFQEVIKNEIASFWRNDSFFNWNV